MKETTPDRGDGYHAILWMIKPENWNYFHNVLGIGTTYQTGKTEAKRKVTALALSLKDPISNRYLIEIELQKRRQSPSTKLKKLKRR